MSAGGKDKEEARPIIVRRRHAGGHQGSHGVWKIAYADFMTALMAFFLVMWLLGGLSDQQLKNVSDYFSMPLKVALTGGDRNSSSKSLIPGGGDDPSHADGEVRKRRMDRGDQNNRRDPASDGKQRMSGRPDTEADAKRLQRLHARLQAQIEQDPRLSSMSSQIKIQVVPDGLLVQISDSRQRPMFELGSARVQPAIAEVLGRIAPTLSMVNNKITLTGHTDDLPFLAGPGSYGNWELSADRANAARRALVGGGMAPEKILRVIGAANTQPMEGDASGSPLNRRISILLLNDQAQRRMEAPAGYDPRLESRGPAEAGRVLAAAEQPAGTATPAPAH